MERKRHQVLGYGYAIAVFFQTLMINMVAGGMLTPGVTEITFAGSGLLSIPFADAISIWFNPILWRLQFHRVFAAISYMGFILAMLAVFHFLDRKGMRDKKYWDWVVSYGITWGLFGLIIQPVLGLIMHAQDPGRKRYGLPDHHARPAGMGDAADGRDASRSCS